VLLLASVGILVLEFVVDPASYRQLAVAAKIIHAAIALTTTALVIGQAWRLGARRFLRERWGDVAFVGVAVVAAAFGFVRVAGAVCALRNLWRFVLHATARFIDRRIAPVLYQRPMALLTLSFALTIVVGTLALMVPAATTSHRGTHLLDAFFTATSAVCVTGLTVVDTGTHFSRFGQWVILILIQVGGLGIMTITTALATVLKAQLSTRMHGAMQEILEESTLVGFRRTLFSILTLTVIFEALGALALYYEMDVGAATGAAAHGERAFSAAFHAISAFCNAGFGLHPDSLVRYARSIPVNLTVCSLIVFGGLGFPVLAELLRPRAWRRGLRPFARSLSVHARLALITTGVLVSLGTVTFLLLEWGGSLKGLPVPSKILAALFQSVTFRTAGFNTVDTSVFHPATLAIGMALMYVGGSPSGTAGGIKTTTLAVLLLAMRAMVFRRADVEVYSRTVSKTDVYRAVSVVVISALALFLVIVFLLVVEADKKMGDVLFEAFSAFGTVGLSTGITAKLSVGGKLAIIVLMFLGRVGPFSIALLAGEGQRGDYAYPAGKVIVG
jgi:trk system potassium uptake protein TrkH